MGNGPSLPGTVIADRLAGAVWGTLTGDAAGVPYEFREPEHIGEFRFGIQGTTKIDPRYAHQVPAGTWSDDGALALALLDSLLQPSGIQGHSFDLDDQGRRFRAWYEGGAYTPDGICFDIGSTTRTALEALAHGVPPDHSGPAGEHNMSNGALMRILPLALVPPMIETTRLAAQTARSSAVTHGHPLCRAVSVVHVLAARRLLADPLRDAPAAGAARALANARADVYALFGTREPIDRGTTFEGFDAADLDALYAWPDRQGRGQVADAFWSAWDAFSTTNSYPATIERAIRYGHDTDTTAAIAGGLAGIWWGLAGIPVDWLAGMRGRSVVEPLVARLWAAWDLNVTRP